MKSCHFYRIAQCSSKNSMTLSSFSMIFHDLCYFPWLSRPGKCHPEFHDFPWPGGTLCQVQPWQVANTHASVTKQYNLVSANGQWCLAVGKVTIGLASLWSCVTYISGSPPMGSRPGRGRWAPTYTLLWSMVDFTFMIIMPTHRTTYSHQRFSKTLWPRMRARTRSEGLRMRTWYPRWGLGVQGQLLVKWSRASSKTRSFLADNNTAANYRH